MTMTKKAPKFEGIITNEVLEKVNKSTSDLSIDYKRFYELIKHFEPNLVEDIRVRGNEAREHFRRQGITGKTLDELTDAIKTFYIRGVMVYRDALSSFDSKKLQEMYGEDYETFQDKLIDEGLKRKRAKKDKNIESIEPQKEGPKELDDLME